MPKFVNGQAVQTEMRQKHSLEAFVWGLKKSASRARELAEAQMEPAWLDVAKAFDTLRESGVTLSKQKAMNSQDVDRALDVIKSRLVVE